MTITEILKQIGATSSTNEKQSILAQHKDNQVLKEILVHTYDTITYTYGMKFNLSIDRIEQHNGPHEIEENFNWETITDILKNRCNRTTGVIQTDCYLLKICSTLTPDSQWLVKKILDRDLGIGISDKTINKVWPKLIPEWPVMLCDTYNEKTSKNITFPAFVQCKADGMRVNIVITGQTDIEFRSRNGKTFQFTQEMHNLFEKMYGEFGTCVLDGELLVQTETGVSDRSTGNGIAGKALKGTITPEEESRLVFKLWDFIPYEDFICGSCNLVYAERMKTLERVIWVLNTMRVRLIITDLVQNMETAMALYQQYLEKGEEGIILKSTNATWQNKRSKFCLKMKAEVDVDLVVRKVVPGEAGTKYESCMGALLCESADGEVSVSVGSGFTDEQRKTITSENMIGKIVKVRANCLISNKLTDTKSLFLPRFLEVRDDKNFADTLDSITMAFKA